MAFETLGFGIQNTTIDPSGDEDRIAAAKQASDEAAATVQQALDAETAIDARIRKLKDNF